MSNAKDEATPDEGEGAPLNGENDDLVVPPDESVTHDVVVETTTNDEGEVETNVLAVSEHADASNIGVTQSSGEGGDVQVVGGETEPQVLNSGDELPAHRQRVESGESTVE